LPNPGKHWQDADVECFTKGGESEDVSYGLHASGICEPFATRGICTHPLACCPSMSRVTVSAVTTSVVNGTVPGAPDANAEHARRALSATE